MEDREKLDGFYECILCLSCSASCPSYWWHSGEYLGPAVLLQAYRWVMDSRDEYTDERLEAIGGDMKLNECFQLGVCTLACPKGLDPRTAIEVLKEKYNQLQERKLKNHYSISS